MLLSEDHPIQTQREQKPSNNVGSLRLRRVMIHAVRRRVIPHPVLENQLDEDC